MVSQATAPGICAEPEDEELLEVELDELLEDELDELDELLVELDEFDVPELVPPHPARNPSDTQAKTNLKKERVFIAGNSSRLLLSLCCSQNDIHIFISPSHSYLRWSAATVLMVGLQLKSLEIELVKKCKLFY